MLCRLLMILAVAMPLGAPIAQAKIPQDKIKIGVLQDLPEIYGGETGEGAIVAAQMAASEYEREYLHGDAEILSHVSRDNWQSDLDKVREWLDAEHVAAVVSSAPGVVNHQIAKMVAKRHVALLITATDSDMGGAACLPGVVVWGTGPSARARALAQVLVPQGKKQWFIVADRTSGDLTEVDALKQAVTAAGGTVVGILDHPEGDTELAKKADQITNSKAQVVALAESEYDLVAMLRNVRLSGLSSRMTMAAPYAQTTDVDHAGPAFAGGLVVPAPFYWAENAQTRHFAFKWSSRMRAHPVTENSAEVYAATLSFLRAAKAADDISAPKVLAELRHAPIKDTLLGTVTVRDDGRVMYDMNVYRVRRPNQIRHRWEYFTRIASVPSAKDFQPDACKDGGKGK